MADFKPNLNFLEKVRDGVVRQSFSYSSRRGGAHRFYGGEATAKKHAKAGYIKMPGSASLGRPSFAKLTDIGVAALASGNRCNGQKEGGK